MREEALRRAAPLEPTRSPWRNGRDILRVFTPKNVLRVSNPRNMTIVQKSNAKTSYFWVKNALQFKRQRNMPNASKRHSKRDQECAKEGLTGSTNAPRTKALRALKSKERAKNNQKESKKGPRACQIVKKHPETCRYFGFWNVGLPTPASNTTTQRLQKSSGLATQRSSVQRSSDPAIQRSDDPAIMGSLGLLDG